MGVIVAPIVDGKTDAWKEWCNELKAPRHEALTDFNRRYGLTRHAVWLAETPSGPVVVVLHEGPGRDEVMAKLGTSKHEFDVWFAGKILELHGFDVTQPPPGPMPELYLDSGS